MNTESFRENAGNEQQIFPCRAVKFKKPNEQRTALIRIAIEGCDIMK